MRRLARLTSDLEAVESIVLVSHGVLLTTWIDHQVGLDDPVSFWTGLRMPDAWAVDLGEKSVERIGQGSPGGSGPPSRSSSGSG